MAARGDGRAVEAARGSLLDPDAQVRRGHVGEVKNGEDDNNTVYILIESN